MKTKYSEDRKKIKQLIADNSVKACKSIGFAMYSIAIVFAIVAILFFAGLFKLSSWTPFLVVFLSALFCLLGFVSRKYPNKAKLVKYFQIYLLLVMVFSLNILTGYKIWLLFSLPIILSSRYYDKSFTLRVGCVTAFFLIASSFANAFLSSYTGFIDLSTVSYSSPGSMDYYGWLNSAVLKHGYEELLVLRNSLILSALPNCLIVALVVFGCISYIKDAEKMLISSYEAAEKEQEQVMLQYYASHDALTGLFNRFSFQNNVEEIKKENTSVGIVFADLNGLKYANDHFGHEAGDKLLLDFTSILTQHFQVDEIFRIGGDEFVCIVKNAIKDVFYENSKQLEGDLNKQEIPIACIGVSFGNSDSIDSLLNEAEKEMYLTKDTVHKKFPNIAR